MGELCPRMGGWGKDTINKFPCSPEGRENRARKK